VSNPSDLRVVDLFAGCGGLSCGFELAGYTIAAAYDSWQPAIDCYKDNFQSHSIFELDLSNVERASRIIAAQTPDIIIGGPPCQDFSQAGKRIENERAALTKCFAEIVAAVNPDFFVMENVARAQRSNVYQEARKTLKEAGYGITEIVLDASLYDVPQRRKRFFSIGGKTLADGELATALEARESLIPLTIRKAYPNFPISHYYRHPRSYTRRAIFSIDEPAPTIRGVNRPRPKTYQVHPKDASKDPSVRSLSPKERLLIQTFPEDYKFTHKCAADIDQMIGNAVPVNLAKAVAEVLAQNALTDTPHPTQTSFRKWLISEKHLTRESAKDKISHIRRANKCHDLPDVETVDRSYIEALESSDQFMSSSASSQQQMKKAVELLVEFAESNFGKSGDFSATNN
jgi:DNA (cytosine-5)-methyltransferase 1